MQLNISEANIMNDYQKPDRTLKQLEITQQILADSKAILDSYGVETLQLILKSLINSQNSPTYPIHPESTRPLNPLFDNLLEQEIYNELRHR